MEIFLFSKCTPPNASVKSSVTSEPGTEIVFSLIGGAPITFVAPMIFSAALVTEPNVTL